MSVVGAKHGIGIDALAQNLPRCDGSRWDDAGFHVAALFNQRDDWNFMERLTRASANSPDKNVSSTSTLRSICYQDHHPLQSECDAP